MSTRNRFARARSGSPRPRALATISALTAAALVVCAAAFSVAAGASTSWSSASSAAAGGGMSALVTAAKAEKTLNVIALPPTWANYGKEISTFHKKYGIKVVSFNPDGTSAEEIQALKQDKGRSSEPDVIDVGESFTAAPDPSLFAAYKVQTWKNFRQPPRTRTATGTTTTADTSRSVAT